MTTSMSARGQSRTMTGRVLLFTLIVAVLLGVVAFFAAQSSAAAAAESRQAEVVHDVVARSESSGGGSYSAITDAIARLDQTGDDQFWLLANNGTILYVKDTNTTNAYRGLPVSNYPSGAELQSLLDSAPLGGMAHATVSMNGVEYLAGATSFGLSGSTYSLCVLTDTATMRGGSSNLPTLLLYVVLAVALILLVVVPTLVTAKLEGAHDVIGAGLVRAFSREAGEAPEQASAAAAAAVPEAVAPGAPGAPAVAAPEAVVPGTAVATAAASAAVAAPEAVIEASEPVAAVAAAAATAPAQEAPVATAAPDLQEDVPAFDPIPLRPESELAEHLQHLLDQGVLGGNMIRIACQDADAMDRVRRRLAALAAGSNANCFAWGENSFLVELYDIDEEQVHVALSRILQSDAEVVAFVPITASE